VKFIERLNSKGSSQNNRFSRSRKLAHLLHFTV